MNVVASYMIWIKKIVRLIEGYSLSQKKRDRLFRYAFGPEYYSNYVYLKTANFENQQHEIEVRLKEYTIADDETFGITVSYLLDLV